MKTKLVIRVAAELNQSAHSETARPTDLLDLIQESMIIFGQDRRIIHWNKASERIYGWPRDTVRGGLIETFFGIAGNWNETQLLNLSQGQPCSGRFSRKTACGRDVFVNAQLALRAGVEDGPSEMVETAIDVTAQHRAEAQTESWRRRYSNVLQAIPVSVWNIDFSRTRALAHDYLASVKGDPLQWLCSRPGRVQALLQAALVTDVNEQTIQLYGPCKRDELLGSMDRFWPESSIPDIARWIVSALSGEVEFSCETRQRRHNGQEFDALFTARFVSDSDDVDHLVATIADNSDFKQGQAAVRESEAFYTDMFHGAAFSAWHLNATGARVIYARLREQGVTDFRQHVTQHPELVTQIMEAITVADVNETSLRLFGAKDRSEIVGGPITPFWFPDRVETLIGSLDASFRNQPIFEGLTPMRTFGGDQIDVLFTRSSSSALRTAGHLLLAIVDMTDKVKAQTALAEMQASFAHAARVSSLGELTASIAHEINQPLAAVTANGEATIRWLARETPDLEKVRGLAEDIIADARRASEVVAHIRSMASPQVGSHKPVSVSHLVQEALTLLGAQLTKCGAIATCDLQGETPMVLGDPVQLQQVIVNLVMNALQAMAGKQSSRLILRTRASAAEVTLTVEDNGPGIRLEDLDRLFGSFFTTKADGMGIGLAICRTIVQAHKGVILAENIISGGARFTVRLPAT